MILAREEQNTQVAVSSLKMKIHCQHKKKTNLRPPKESFQTLEMKAKGPLGIHNARDPPFHFPTFFTELQLHPFKHNVKRNEKKTCDISWKLRMKAVMRNIVSTLGPDFAF